MNSPESSFKPIRASSIHPDVSGLLEPGEQVFWQEQPPRKSLWLSIVVVLAIMVGIAWQEGLLENPEELIQGASLPAFALIALFAVVLIAGLIGAHYYRRNSTVYALTSQRVMRTFKGRVVQQATPEKLQFRSTPRPGSVSWYNVDYPPDSDSRGRQGFAHVEDGHAVYRLLQDWQKTIIQEIDKRAEASSEAFRQHTESAGVEAEAEAEARSEAQAGTEATSASVQKVKHPEHGFSLDVPAEWDLEVGQDFDGPVKVFGITLIKRITRPATPRPYKPGDDSPWNRMTLRGGPSTGLNIKINPARMYDEAEVLNDRWGKRLGMEVKFVERDIEIAGFRGFAVVREFPAGSSPMGFGKLPLAVISRQWWLSGHGLDLEIQGIAPIDSATLQRTIDLTVGSLRSDNG